MKVKQIKSTLMLIMLTIPVSAWPSAGSGLQMMAAGDLVASFGGTAENRFDPREVELGVFGPIDPTFDGALYLAAHREGGVSYLELHEVTVSSTKLIPRSRFRIGHFFLGVGRLNQVHRHDWPFISAPKMHRDWFGEEAAGDTGVELGTLLPLPFYLDLSGGLTSGWTFGHSHSEGQLPRLPTHYLRLATFINLPSDGGLQIGLNYLGRVDAALKRTTLLGADLTAKWREGKTLRWLFQSEVWMGQTQTTGSAAQTIVGGYFYPQYGFGGGFEFGLRLDASTSPSLRDALGLGITNYSLALVPTLTYRPSEFMVLRVGGTTGWTALGSQMERENKVELQATFLLGAHPAHTF